CFKTLEIIYLSMFIRTIKKMEEYQTLAWSLRTQKRNIVKGSKYHCCVPLCGGDSRYDSSLSFHRFPKETKANTAVRKQWLAKIQRKIGKTFQISSATRVCSRHFRKEDFKPATSDRPYLKRGAIPSIFEWSVQQPKARRSIVRNVQTFK
ncbi:hypothetical protein QZH41_019572, partial [Actinostola sp. cb2023]